MRISDWSSDVCSSDLHEILDKATVPVVTIAVLIMAFFGLKQSSIFSGEEVWSGAVTPNQPESPATHEKKEINLLFFSPEDRTTVVSGKRVSVRVDLGGRRIIKKTTKQHPTSYT